MARLHAHRLGVVKTSTLTCRDCGATHETIWNDSYPGAERAAILDQEIAPRAPKNGVSAPRGN